MINIIIIQSWQVIIIKCNRNYQFAIFNEAIELMITADHSMLLGCSIFQKLVAFDAWNMQCEIRGTFKMCLDFFAILFMTMHYKVTLSGC